MKNLAPILLLSCVFSPLSVSAQQGEVIDRCYLAAINDVSLAADEAGKLIEIFVKEGEAIDARQVVAQIDDNDAVMAREVAGHKYAAAKKTAENEVSVKAAMAANGVAEAALQMVKEANLKRPGAYTETEVLKHTLERDRSRYQIDFAKNEILVALDEARASLAQYKQAQEMIERRKLKAPFGAMVNQVIREAGEWVNVGDPVVHLVQMDRLRVHGSVEANRLHWKDLSGRPVEVTVQLPGGATHVVDGTIGFASPVVDIDGNFRVWADIENSLVGESWLMGPGLPASIKLR
jgi:macrolide-specific efflux system membrane fusion protein